MIDQLAVVVGQVNEMIDRQGVGDDGARRGGVQAGPQDITAAPPVTQRRYL